MSRSEGWWYLSFADSEKFLGGLFVYGDGSNLMIKTLHSLKLNPGGEIEMHGPGPPPPDKYRGHILTREEIEEWDNEYTSFNN